MDGALGKSECLAAARLVIKALPDGRASAWFVAETTEGTKTKQKPARQQRLSTQTGRSQTSKRFGDLRGFVTQQAG